MPENTAKKNFFQLREDLRSDLHYIDESKINLNKSLLFNLLEKEEKELIEESTQYETEDIDYLIESCDVLSEKYISYILSSRILKEQEEDEEEVDVNVDTPEEVDIDKMEDTDPEEVENEKEELSKELDDHIEKETDEQKKAKLQVLKNIIRQKLIYKFAETPVDVNRITKILTNFILDGKDENSIKNELEQRSFIDFSLDVINILLKNKRLASLVGVEATTESYDIGTENVITEAKKQRKAKKKVEDKFSPKLDMLLRLGLVDKKLYARAKRALSNKKASGSISVYRNLLFDLLDDIIQYIQKDPTLYNRMRINVMKEMKNSLPKKEDLIAAYESGVECRECGLNEEEMPEEYMKDEFLREAWYKGFNSGKKKEDLPKFKKPFEKDSPHYRTDHHYGHGDIDPEDVPIFKSSLNKKDDEEVVKERFKNKLSNYLKGNR